MAGDYSTQAKGGFESVDQDFSDSEFNGIGGIQSIPGSTNMMPTTNGTHGTHGHRNGILNSPPPMNNVASNNNPTALNDGNLGTGAAGYRSGGMSGSNSQRNGNMSGPTRMGSMAGTSGSAGITASGGMNNTASNNGTTNMNGATGMNGTAGMNGLTGMNGGNIYRDGAPSGVPSMNGASVYRPSALKRSYSRVDPDIEKLMALRRKRSTATITITPELLEKMDAPPQESFKGDLRKSLGNPTPIGLLGTVLALGPLSCDLMGWRGTSGIGAASIGAYFFFGGLLLLFSGILEFIIGNTFPFVVFMSFGAFWLTLGATLRPDFNAYGAYSPNPSSPGEGLLTVDFNASFGFFLVFMAILSFVYFICALRTNITYVVIFLSLVIGFGLDAGQHFQLALGNTDIAAGLQIAAGATYFVTSVAALWIFFSIMLEVLDFPVSLPVGDISTFIKSKTILMEEEKAMEELMYIEDMRHMEDMRHLTDTRHML